jgi:hypothetical protein
VLILVLVLVLVPVLVVALVLVLVLLMKQSAVIFNISGLGTITKINAFCFINANYALAQSRTDQAC